MNAKQVHDKLTPEPPARFIPGCETLKEKNRRETLWDFQDRLRACQSGGKQKP